MPHVRDLPNVQPFTVDALGLEFIDQRTLEGSAPTKAFKKWVEHVSVIFEQRNINFLEDVFCGSDTAKTQREIELFHKALETSPGLDFLEWQDTRTPERDNSLDPMRPDIFFCVRDTSTGEWVGGFSVSNLNIETDDIEKVVCGGIMLLGIPNTIDLVTTWVTAYRTILNVPCTMEDGRKLHLVEDRFLSDQQLRNAAATDSEIIEMWNRMGDYFSTTGDITNPEQNTSIRRLG